MKPILLIVDDDEEIRSQLKWALQDDYDLSMAGDRAEALTVFADRKPPVVLLDLGLPPNPGNPVEGMGALADMVALDPFCKVIIASGQGERRNALQAIADGAYDFLAKPVELDELKVILRRAFHVAQLERDNKELQAQVPAGDGFEGILGVSPKMQDVFTTIRKVAASDVPVMILGESGTGKEVVARAIHRRSSRRAGQFVAINCGAIPEALLESELFGHEKGSFTGAHAQRKGRFELANGGTLFLDEVGELPLQLQVKLLRFLQDRQIERVGGRGPIDVDARILAATNRDLRKEVEAGRFREDLYYRLAVIVTRLPPLRERQGDVRVLAQAFLRIYATQANREMPRFSDAAVRALEQHDWPGNVRELENRVKRAVVMAEGKRISSEDLELDSVAPTHLRTLKEARDDLDREMLQQALKRHRGKISRAAEELGISRPTFYEIMARVGIENPKTAEADSP